MTTSPGGTSEIQDAPEPTLDEVRTLSRELIAELRAGLADDRWALLPNERTMAHAHAGASASHCAYLLRELIDAHDRGSEMLARLAARALFETWLLGYYIALGGYAALERVGASYAAALWKQHNSIAEHNSRIRAQRAKIRKRNRSIRRRNENVERWNAAHPDEPPKPLTAPLQDPVGEEVDFDLAAHLHALPYSEPAPLSLTNLIDEVGRLTREQGKAESYEAGYNLAYRGLSTLGAHANLFVLNTYLDDRHGNGVFVRVRPDASVPSTFEEPNLHMGLLLTAAIVQAAFEARSLDTPNATRIMNIYASAFDRPATPPTT